VEDLRAMEERGGIVRGGALGRTGIGVEGLDGVGVALGVGRDDACLDCDEKSRSGSGDG